MSSRTQSRARARILVIEDTPELLELISIVLTSAGHTVFEAANGAQGLLLARREVPDLIMVDIEMPGMDGLSVLQQMRQDTRLAGRPIVALTAVAMKGDRERLLAAGFTGYIPKPIRAQRLVGQLRPFLSQATRRRRRD